MIEDSTLSPGHGDAAEPRPRTEGGLAGARRAGESMQRPSLRFPPRLEISPLTIRRPAGPGGDERLPVH